MKCPGRTLTIYNGAIVWIPAAAAATAGTPGVAPDALAAQAARALSLPAPVIHTDPASFGVVNLATWLWIDASSWHSFSTTARAGDVSATAVATPISVQWNMGNGQSVDCRGPGTPYQTNRPVTSQTTDCSFTYRTSSIGQPSPDGNPDDGAFTLTASITWDVSWSATGVPGGGTLPPIHTGSSAQMRVEQIESIDTAS